VVTDRTIISGKLRADLAYNLQECRRRSCCLRRSGLSLHIISAKNIIGMPKTKDVKESERDLFCHACSCRDLRQDFHIVLIRWTSQTFPNLITEQKKMQTMLMLI